MRAVCAVRPIDRIRVYSRDPAKRDAFAKQMSEELGLDVVAAPNPRECIEGADVVTTITRSAEPVLLGDWIAGDTHVNLADCGDAVLGFAASQRHPHPTRQRQEVLQEAAGINQRQVVREDREHEDRSGR